MNKKTKRSMIVLAFVMIFVVSVLSPNPMKPKMENGVRLSIIGDYGVGSYDEALVSMMIREWNVDAIVTVGDNVMPSGSLSDYQLKVYPYYGWMIKRELFFPALGNHDWGYLPEEIWEADNLPLLQEITYLPGNGRYYTKVFGDNLVEIFVIDSDDSEPDGRTFDSIQGQWLETQLDNSYATYKLVFFHEPPFSSCLFKDSGVMNWPFLEWGADAVFSGHCHFYERIMKDGFPYFINGLGGDHFPTKFEVITGGSVERFIGGFGAQLIEATPEKMVISFITTDGDVIDSYVIFGTNR